MLIRDDELLEAIRHTGGIAVRPEDWEWPDAWVLLPGAKDAEARIVNGKTQRIRALSDGTKLCQWGDVMTFWSEKSCSACERSAECPAALS